MILYLFAEIISHNCYYSVCMNKHSNNTVVLCYLTIRLARHLCSSTPLVYMYVLLASESSERDTYRGNTMENRGCLLASECSERDSIRGG